MDFATLHRYHEDNESYLKSREFILKADELMTSILILKYVCRFGWNDVAETVNEMCGSNLSGNACRKRVRRYLYRYNRENKDV